MIKIFQSTDNIFDTNGDYVIQPNKAVVHKEDNGEFYLDIECGLQYADYLKPNYIVVAPTPQGEQPFRIKDVTKTKHKVVAKVRHLYYDSENYLIADAYVVDKNCNDALDHLNSATDNPSPFTTISDINTVASFRCVRKSLSEAVQTILERWGGHLVRDKWNIGVRANIGQDNGVTIQYGKNLKDISVEYNWQNVVTKIMPVGYDGILLPEEYLYSGTQYDIPYTKTVSFTQEIDQESFKDADGNVDETAYQNALIEDLRNQGQEYVDKNCVPQVTYTLKANLEKMTDIGDTIQVEDERLGVSILTNVIQYDYDCILGKYTEVVFGNFQQKLSGLVESITSTTESIVEENNGVIRVTLEQELQQATSNIWNALGNSYCIYEGDKILVVDSLPKETATNVIMISSGGIGFSNTGINGTFSTAWTIDGTLNMQAINVINMTADMIKGGTLKLGSNLNQSGVLELYGNANNLIGQMDKDGLKMFGLDGSYVLMNNQVGFAGFDRTGNKIYWVSQDEFHMKKSVVEEEITLCGKMRFIPITITQNGTVVNDGIGLVSTAGGVT